MLFEKMRSTYRIKKRSAIAMALVVMMSILATGAIFDRETKKVTLVIKDIFSNTETQRNVVTRKVTVGEFLEEQGIVLADDEVVNADLADVIVAGANITVAKSKMVEVRIDGTIRFERTTEKTVGETLTGLGIVLSETDTVNPQAETEISDNMVIVVDRIEIVEEVKEIPIPYKAIKKNDASMYVGQKTVKQYGVPGKIVETSKVVKKNGEEISRELIKTERVSEPIDEIVIWGTKQKAEVTKKKTAVSTSNKNFKSASKEASSAATNSGKGFKYSNVYTMTATAYDPSPGTNAGYSKTAYGLIPQYGVVAVDPKVIPLGTKLYIESADGGKSWVYGYCIAGDTGGAIKGYKVDLCYNTKAECKKFGRQQATVYVLE